MLEEPGTIGTLDVTAKAGVDVSFDVSTNQVRVELLRSQRHEVTLDACVLGCDR